MITELMKIVPGPSRITGKRNTLRESLYASVVKFVPTFSLSFSISGHPGFLYLFQQLKFRHSIAFKYLKIF